LRIIFLNKSGAGYRSLSFTEIENYRGTQRTILHLAEEFVKNGHDVSAVSGDGSDVSEERGITLIGLQEARAHSYDVAISINFASAFNDIRAKAKVIWAANPGFSWGHIRDDFVHKLRHRPVIVHLSEYSSKRSWFLPKSGNDIIPYGASDDLFPLIEERPVAPPPTAVFSSVPARNLALSVRVWRDLVHPALPEARLLVTGTVAPKHVCHMSTAELEACNIEVIGRQPWSSLMQLFKRSRVLVMPGHFQETFNLIAIEGAACGLPTVTLGIGSLKERVGHDRTGWIAADEQDMAEALKRVLSDDEVWMRYHKNCLSHPDLIGWPERAKQWEKLLELLNQRSGPGKSALERPVR
jgi:glycosyltransferase involved in cell wall biosynthesis